MLGSLGFGRMLVGCRAVGLHRKVIDQGMGLLVGRVAAEVDVSIGPVERSCPPDLVTMAAVGSSPVATR